MKSALHIGSSKESVEAATNSIIKILNVKLEAVTGNVLCEALISLRTLCEVKHITVQNCIFKGIK